MAPLFFETQKQFRSWFEKYHQKETELIVGFYKTACGKPSITWPQSVDEALCFGWIDGVRKSINNESYQIRFTPRKPTSIWSAVNIKKIETLTQQGLMKQAGHDAFAKRKESRSKVYSFETDVVALDAASEKKFKANKQAWAFFTSQAPSYQKAALHWITTAKQEKTKASRLQTLMADSEVGKKLKAMSYNKNNNH